MLAADVGDPGVDALVGANEQLAAKGIQLRAEAIEFFTVGAGRPAARIHQMPFFWVENDARRIAQGNDITYLVDQSDGATARYAAPSRYSVRTCSTWRGLSIFSDRARSVHSLTDDEIG